MSSSPNSPVESGEQSSPPPLPRQPLAREHSYLPSDALRLLPAPAPRPRHGGTGSSTSSPPPPRLRPLAVMPLEIVVFPGETLPIRLRDRAWVRHVARLIAAAASSSAAAPAAAVQFGVLCAAAPEPDAARRARRSWTRRALGPRRLGRLSARLVAELEEEMGDGEAGNGGGGAPAASGRGGGDDDGRGGAGAASDHRQEDMEPPTLLAATLAAAVAGQRAHRRSSDGEDRDSGISEVRGPVAQMAAAPGDAIADASNLSGHGPEPGVSSSQGHLDVHVPLISGQDHAHSTRNVDVAGGDEPEGLEVSEAASQELRGGGNERANNEDGSIHSDDTSELIPALMPRRVHHLEDDDEENDEGDSDEDSSLPALVPRAGVAVADSESGSGSDLNMNSDSGSDSGSGYESDPGLQPPVNLIQETQLSPLINMLLSGAEGFPSERLLPILQSLEALGQAQETPIRIGHVGTIVSVLCSHGDDSEGDELVVTAYGTSRFRIASEITDDVHLAQRNNNARPNRAPLQMFLVEEIEDEFISLPCIPPSIRGSKRQKTAARVLAMVTPFPEFVHWKYSPWRLMDSILELLSQVPAYRGLYSSLPQSGIRAENQNNAGIMEPLHFGYWLASNLPFSNKEKLEILELDSGIVRLEYIYDAMLKHQDATVQCKNCGIPLTKARHIFTVGGADGTTGNYVNRYGVVHQTMTVRELNEDEVRYQGALSTEDSWFPGYGYYIVHCAFCLSHLGWKFQLVDRAEPTQDRPRTFFGLTATGISTE